MLNDLIISTKIKEGDIKAFEILFKRYYSPLCLYSASIIHDTEQAEEIVEDIFYKLWKNKEKISILSSIKSYLYKSVRNNSLLYSEHCRIKEKYIQNINIINNNIKYPNPQSSLEYKEIELIINRTLGKLPPRRTRIFNMHRIEGKKYSEIAGILSISIKTVESEITKTLKILRNEIEQYIN